MACVLVPAAEAIVVTIANKVTAKRAGEDKHIDANEVSVISFHEKVKWLRNMLWGGSGLLAFEHIWHGEIIPVFPFLTAAESASGLTEMLNEMATTGVTMAALVTAVWGLMLLGAGVIERRTIALYKSTK